MHSPRLAIATLLLTAALVASCGGGGGPKVDPVPRRILVTALSSNVILPTIELFVTRAQALESALATLAASPNDVAARDAAKVAWTEAIRVWQQLEVMQVGPAAPSTAMGGQDLRASIYAWEIANSCRVDGVLATGGYATTAELGVQVVDRRGLAAIEDLLWYEGATSRCSGNAGLLAGVVDLPQARATYALTAGTLVREAAEALRSAWSPSGQDFLGQVSSAGEGSNVFRSAQSALNAFTDAMFYIETEAKDMKVAIPAGISVACSSAPSPCPGLVESRFAGLSVDHLRQNLLGFRRMFLGGEPGGTENGFDDLLTSLGQGALATQMASQIEAALASLDAVDGPLEMAVSTDAADVAAMHAAFQALATSLKMDFRAILDIQLPTGAAGDND